MMSGRRWLSYTLTRAQVYRSGGRSPAGVPLPPVRLRQGGAHYRSDEAFIGAGLRDAQRCLSITSHARTSNARSARILDLGCGSGRLAFGLMEVGEFRGSYIGIEVQKHHVDWCRRNISRRDARFEFAYMDAANRRYNASGKVNQRLPVGDSTADVFYASSVFTHMAGEDVRFYLSEARRTLRPEGRGVFTAFAEEDVPDEQENPPGYGPMAWSGDLHCVRFSVERVLWLVGETGLKVTDWSHATEPDGQSVFFLSA